MSLAVRSRAVSGVARCVVARRNPLQPRAARFARLVVFSTVPEIEKKLDEAFKKADEVCGDTPSADCAVAWDEVEELSAAVAHKKVADKVAFVDPLDAFCGDNPDADECRVYED
jgi:hypothetical protein